MTCPDCERLAAALAEATDELAEWHARDDDAERSAAEDARMWRWRERLGVTPAIGLALMWMVDRPGRLVDRLAILAVTRTAPGIGLDQEPNLRAMAVTVCKARMALRRLGLAEALETVWGRGWRVTPAGAVAIKAAMGDPA